jgi:hypothetical protein
MRYIAGSKRCEKFRKVINYDIYFRYHAVRQCSTICNYCEKKTRCIGTHIDTYRIPQDHIEDTYDEFNCIGFYILNIY